MEVKDLDSGRSRGLYRSVGRDDVTGAEAVDDATFAEVVGCHFHLHAVARQNADFVHPHAPGQVAKKLMITRFIGSYANT